MKSIKLFVISGVLGMLLSGCASVPVMEMTRSNYVKAPVYVENLSFEKFKRPADWESDEKWNKHVESWQQVFMKDLKNGFSEVRTLDNSAKQGLIVRTYVTDIKREYIQMWGGSDKMTFQVEYYDAATKEKIGQNSFITDSSGAGVLSYTFGGRMGECASEAGDMVGQILKKNQ